MCGALEGYGHRHQRVGEPGMVASWEPRTLEAESGKMVKSSSLLS